MITAIHIQPIQCHYGMRCYFKDTTCTYLHVPDVSVGTKCHRGELCPGRENGKCKFEHGNKTYLKAAFNTICRYNFRCSRTECKYLHDTSDKKSPAFHGDFMNRLSSAYEP